MTFGFRYDADTDVLHLWSLDGDVVRFAALAQAETSRNADGSIRSVVIRGARAAFAALPPGEIPEDLRHIVDPR